MRKAHAKWHRKACHDSMHHVFPNQLRGLGAIRSLAQAMPMKPKALKMVMSLLKFLGRDMRCFFLPPYPKKAYSPQKRLLFTTLLRPKNRIFGFNSCSLFQIKCCHLNLSHSGDFRCKSNAFWSTSSSGLDESDHLQLLVVPTRPAWAPNFLNESLKWWFVLEYHEDWSPSLLKLASCREYRKQHAPNFNHPSGLLHDPLGAGSGGRTALFFLLLCDQPDQLVSKHKNALLTVFTESSEESHEQTCFLLKSLYNSCVIAIDCNKVA